MTISKEIYTANQSYNYTDSVVPHKDKFSDSRRPYDLEEVFNYKQHWNQNPTFKTLIRGDTFSLSTNQNDSADFHYVENVNNIMKTSTSSNVKYAKLYWKTATSTYWNTIGCGGGFGNDSYYNYGYYLPNVVGMTFTWRREGGHSSMEVGCRAFGMNFYSPRMNSWRSVRWTPASNDANTGDYLSPEGDIWKGRGGNLGNLSGGASDSNWNIVQATMSADNMNEILYGDDWLWGGVFFEVKANGKGGKGNQEKILKLCDLQPIFGPYIPDNQVGPRVILPANHPIDPSSRKDGMYINY